MRTQMLTVLSVTLSLGLAAPALASAAATVEAEGQAMVKNGDEPAAMRSRGRPAQGESAVGTMISAETVRTTRSSRTESSPSRQAMTITTSSHQGEASTRW